MPVTPEQGRMIAHLAVACRPHGAPRWDEAGTLAAIKKVATWNLAIVVDHVVKHASDPRAVSPGVIGSSFTPPDLVRPTPVPPKKHEQCGRCGEALPGCACTREDRAVTYVDEAPVPPPSWTPGDTAAGAKAVRDALRAVRGNGNDEEGL